MSSQPGIRSRVIEPDGRIVVLTDDAWDHIRSEHPEMARYEREISNTITHPDDRRPDLRPGRERYFGRDRGPSKWLRVLVDFNEEPGEVVTAFGQDNEP